MKLHELDRWLGAEQARLDADYPRSLNALRSLSQRRLLVVAVLFVGVSLGVQSIVGPGADTGLFDQAGRELLSRHALQTFGDPTIQTGPLYLLVAGIGSLSAEALHLPGWTGVSVLTSLMVAALVWLIGTRLVAALPVMQSRDTSGLLLAVGLSAPIALAAALGHPDDLIVGLLVIAAAERMYHGAALSAGAILGVAIGIKLWAVVAVGVLAMRGWRALARSLPVALAIGTACYGPFIVFGAFRTLHFVWGVEADAPVAFFVPESHSFPWSLRLLQAAAAGTVGLVLAYKARTVEMIWLAPAAIVASRLLFDPRSIEYYWSPVVASFAIGTWLLRDTRPVTRGVLLFAWVVPVQLLLASLSGVAGRVVVTILALAVVGLAFAQRIHTRPGADQGETTAPM